MVRFALLATIFGSCSSPSMSEPSTTPGVATESKPREHSESPRPTEHPFVVLGQLLHEQEEARRGDPNDVPNRIVDSVVLAAFHRKFAEKLRAQRERLPPDTDPLRVTMMEAEEQRHLAEVEKWTAYADVAARELGPSDSGETPSDPAQEYDHAAFCSQWAQGPNLGDAERRLVVQSCEQVHVAVAAESPAPTSIPRGCREASSFGGGSIIVAIRCGAALAPLPKPAFGADPEGRIVRGTSPEHGPTLRMMLTVLVAPSNEVRAISLTAIRSKDDPKRAQLVVSLSEVTDIALGFGMRPFACDSVELWRSEKWKATDSTKGNQRYTTVLDASYDTEQRFTFASLPSGALRELAASRRAGGSYCGLEFEFSSDQLGSLRSLVSAKYGG